jgi:hypothetical protein
MLTTGRDTVRGTPNSEGYDGHTTGFDPILDDDVQPSFVPPVRLTSTLNAALVMLSEDDGTHEVGFQAGQDRVA